MKVRDSGMPEEDLWATFFDPELLLQRLRLEESAANVVEFGCGYGTFTCPAAGMITGQVHAFDIDPDMIEATRRKADAAGLTNVRCHLHDFVAEGTRLPDGSADYAMLFNILHMDRPLLLLGESHRVLGPNRKLGIIHWNYDATTPRGPSMDIRPKPEQCQGWAEESGFRLLEPIIDLPPYHYGMVVARQ